MPKVSVIIPSYNHERFVQECIESVLNQTFQDFEILITDDGSTDHTVDVIRRFTDPRINLFIHSRNRGACVAANNCIRHSSGEYVAMLSSDDAWLPEKLQQQVRYLDAHPKTAAVFGKVEWIDATGQSITDPGFPYLHVFDVKNRSRFQWLHHFFFEGNCLCHPCSLVRRTCYDAVGWLDSSMANLPDFDLWIRLCLKYPIHILDEKQIRFRRINESSNASGDNIRSRRRNRFENKQVLNHYLKLRGRRELLAVFPDAAKYGRIANDLIPFFVARTAIDRGLDFMALWGLDVIYDLLKDEGVARRLEEQCDFAYRDLIKLTGESRIFTDLAPYEMELSRKYTFETRIHQMRIFLFPPGSSRERIARRAFRLLRPLLQRIRLSIKRHPRKAPLAS